MGKKTVLIRRGVVVPQVVIEIRCEIVEVFQRGVKVRKRLLT